MNNEQWETAKLLWRAAKAAHDRSEAGQALEAAKASWESACAAREAWRNRNIKPQLRDNKTAGGQRPDQNDPQYALYRAACMDVKRPENVRAELPEKPDPMRVRSLLDKVRGNK